MKQLGPIVKLFNTKEEVGVRLLYSLNETKEKMSLSRLVYYDYFALHLDDIDGNLESLHPSNPSHSTELIVRREIIKCSLELMALKGLLDVKYTAQGIYYKYNSITEKFLSFCNSNYAKQLQKNFSMVHTFFLDFTDYKLEKYIANNIGKWAGEFEKEYKHELMEENNE